MNLKDIIPWPEKVSGTWGDFENSFHSLRKEMDRLMSGFGSASPGLLGGFAPKIDISENDSVLKVTAELPGMEQKDIDLSIRDGYLILKGEKKQETEEKDDDHHLVERSYGSFQRVIPLPRGVDMGKIQANFKKGVLKIEVPKTAEAKQSSQKVAIAGE